MGENIIVTVFWVMLGVVLTILSNAILKSVKKNWWEEEAEEQGLPVKQYLDILKMEKEHAQLRAEAMERWVRKHKKKLDRLSRDKKWEFVFEEKYEAEQKKVKGYEEIARVHSAYITILLKRLGATQDNMVTVTAAEIKEAMQKYEARAVPSDGSWGLYCEVIAEE